MALFWVVAPYGLLEDYQHFWGVDTIADPFHCHSATTSNELGSGTNDSATCIAVCLGSLTPQAFSSCQQ